VEGSLGVGVHRAEPQRDPAALAVRSHQAALHLCGLAGAARLAEQLRAALGLEEREPAVSVDRLRCHADRPLEPAEDPLARHAQIAVDADLEGEVGRELRDGAMALLARGQLRRALGHPLHQLAADLPLESVARRADLDRDHQWCDHHPERRQLGGRKARRQDREVDGSARAQQHEGRREQAFGELGVATPSDGARHVGGGEDGDRLAHEPEPVAGRVTEAPCDGGAHQAVDERGRQPPARDRAAGDQQRPREEQRGVERAERMRQRLEAREQRRHEGQEAGCARGGPARHPVGERACAPQQARTGHDEERENGEERGLEHDRRSISPQRRVACRPPVTGRRTRAARRRRSRLSAAGGARDTRGRCRPRRASS
jgi:hypothetical protein